MNHFKFWIWALHKAQATSSYATTALPWFHAPPLILPRAARPSDYAYKLESKAATRPEGRTWYSGYCMGNSLER